VKANGEVPRSALEQKIAEQAALLDIASDAIFVRDMNDRITYWNHAAETTYGWSQADALGKRADTLLYTEANRRETDNARGELLARGAWSGELHVRSRSGQPMTIQAGWTLVRNAAGLPSGVLSVGRDVTQERSIQAQLARSQRLQSIGSLAAGVAHDLNNVLCPILMGLQSIRAHEPDAALLPVLDLMEVSATRGAALVSQILGFARGSRGERTTVPFRHILSETEAIIRQTFPRDIAISSDIPHGLWDVKGDATQLHEVVMNICSNARDAMPSGGKLTISAHNVSLDDAYERTHVEAQAIPYVMLKVEDTGGGMSADVVDRIFDPFFTTKEPKKGTGLGLSISRAIVKDHGGFINVYSEKGRGTSFKVYIPSCQNAASPAPSSAPACAADGGGGELVLVVDDDGPVRNLTAHILRTHGYEVITAADGAEALQHVADRGGDIRLTITDVSMPLVDGVALIRALRELKAGTRVIVTSGLDENQSASLGADGFLSKPFSLAALLREVHRVLHL
jgi:PAS domain S-box-containing protein